MARKFNGTSDYLKGSSVPLTTYPITVSIWGLPGTTPSTAGMMYEIADTAGNFCLCSLRLTGGVSPQIAAQSFQNSPSAITRTAATPLITSISQNVWFHAAGTFTSTTNAAFYNGGSKTSFTTAAITAQNQTLELIGADNSISGPPIGLFWYAGGTGSLADLGVWNVVLTDDEIFALGQGVRPYQIRPQNLVVWRPLEGLGNFDQDYIGFNTATFGGGSPIFDTYEPPALLLPKFPVPQMFASVVVRGGYFARSYFPGRYFAPRYFCIGAVAPPPGSSLQFNALLVHVGHYLNR